MVTKPAAAPPAQRPRPVRARVIPAREDGSGGGPLPGRASAQLAPCEEVIGTHRFVGQSLAFF